MNGLLPIVRRKRRPLLEAETVVPVFVGNIAAVQAVVPPSVVEPVVKETESQASDGKITSKRSAR